MVVQPLSRLATYWTIGGIMLVAMLLRVTMLDITPYNIDEAAASIFASQIAHLRAFPLIGIETSQGFHNPPLFLYLLAPLFATTPDPRFAMFFFAILGTVGVALTGLTARRLWGGWAAVIAAMIVCFSPTAIEHSRRLWGHDTIIFWSSVSIYCMVRSLQANRRRWSWTALAAAAGAQACHLSGVTLWIVPVGMLVMARPRNWRVSLAIGVAVLLFIYSPWFLYDAGIGRPEGAKPQPAFTEMKTMLGLSTGEARPQPESPVSVPLSWATLLNDSASNEILSEEYGSFLRDEFVFGWLHPIIQIAAALLLIGGIIALAFDAWRSRASEPESSRWAALLAAAAVAPMVLFGVLPVTSVPSYQLPAFVPGALGAAYLLTRGRGIQQFALWKELRVAAIPAPRLFTALAICAIMAIYGSSYVVASRVFVRNATVDEFVSPVLKFKLDAITFIAASATTSQYAILQDGRTHAAGVDYWVLYLHWYVSNDPRTPTLRAAPHAFLIIDNRTILREPLEAFIATRDYTRFGTLRVYRLVYQDAENWRRLTELYPSSAPQAHQPIELDLAPETSSEAGTSGS